MSETSLVWLRQDLRVRDNPALTRAIADGGRVVALYVHETGKSARPPGGAARWWLHRSLVALETELARLGIPLDVATGDAEAAVANALARHGARAVYWNRRYAPAGRAADARLKSAFMARGVTVESFAANLLVEPFDLKTSEGRPYSVFTPFWKALRMRDIPHPMPRPGPAGVATPSGGAADAAYSAPRWTAKLARYWEQGEAAAVRRLETFIAETLNRYGKGRDIPSAEATSGLSAHLRFGEISPRQVWHAVRHAADAAPDLAEAADTFLSELAWRDFSYNLLFHNDDIARHPMRPAFAGMDWRDDAEGLRCWQAGQTGIPIVDAGMRELWETGVMHNRVRMLTASLLAKNLLIDWREGEAWFWDTLVDADPANNPASWQWVAGCGADAAPYFRIFNPVTQGEKFDPDGTYVRRWVPEIAALPDTWIHKPSEAPRDVLASAGIALGEIYPRAIVDPKATRARALETYRALREKA